MGWRALRVGICLLAVSAGVLAGGFVGDRLFLKEAQAVKDCTASAGASCYPGSDYTADFNWDCGPFYPTIQYCFEPTNCMSPICAHDHSYGWGSADYDGDGTVFVSIVATCSDKEPTCNRNPDPPVWGGIAEGLVRACAVQSCNDVDVLWFVGVTHVSDARHTIYGHAKA